jgi:fatty-acyl-CoA synthase
VIGEPASGLTSDLTAGLTSDLTAGLTSGLTAEVDGVLPLPGSTYQLVLDAAAAWPQAVATQWIADPARYEDCLSWTFSDLAGVVTRTANAFTTLGVNREQAVTLCGANTAMLYAATLAAEAVGIAAPINPALPPERILELVRRTGSRVLVAAGPELDARVWQGMLRVAHACGMDAVLALRPDSATGAPPPLPDDSAADDGLAGDPPGSGLMVAYLDDVVAGQPADRLVGARAPEPEDFAAFVHTGGTTGSPKIAAQTHGNQVACARGIAVATGLAPGEAVLAGLPLFHVNALLVTGIAPMFRGNRVDWPGPLGYRDPRLITGFWKVVEHHRIAAMSAVPTVYGALMRVPIDADISSLRLPIVGASPLPAAVREGFERHTGVTLCEGYGLTEATCASTVCLPGEGRPGSVGRALPGQQVKAVRLREDGQWEDCGPDEVGVLAIGGPAVFSGYLTDPALGGPRVSADGVVRDGWLDTGDLGRVDPDGFVYLTGRAKDLIIRGGHNIDPRVIEEALLAHPSVLGAAAVGRPDRHSGEVPVAYVVPADPDAFDEEALLAHAAATIGEPAARPKRIHSLAAIPVTEVGKHFKPALVADAAARAVTDALDEAGLPATGRVVAAAHEQGRVVVTVTGADARRVAEAVAGFALAVRTPDRIGDGTADPPSDASDPDYDPDSDPIQTRIPLREKGRRHEPAPR